MARLINEMLDLTQFNIGKDILHRETVHMQSFISEMCEKLKSDIEKKKLLFSLSVSKEVENLELHVDKEKMYSALFNVIDNGVKYTRAGSIAVAADVFIHPIEKTKQFRLVVSDTGIGLSPEDVKRLFQHFFERGADAETLNVTGRGIGLVLTKQIIEAHGGRIWAESRGEGQGSAFHVEIPIEMKEE
jgi:signal transduction histidine kinase